MYCGKLKNVKRISAVKIFYFYTLKTKHEFTYHCAF